MSVTLRELKIKTGVVKRLFKEEKYYRQEAEKQQKRIDKLTEDGTDKHTIAKQKEVLQESLNMIPDCQNQELKQAEEIFEEVNKEIENE
ncbi:14095_t:CDS:2 [Funneliformis mosseae]|uniref:Tubulin-specific chaperone A n=1 Tax=Funneliformis mosseae TaxID=27381 RepID=A0A9N8ZRJ9_FUNMO|nr:14095_t:CDS:2 [Funneliformis mosseae]